MQKLSQRRNEVVQEMRLSGCMWNLRLMHAEIRDGWTDRRRHPFMYVKIVTDYFSHIKTCCNQSTHQGHQNKLTMTTPERKGKRERERGKKGETLRQQNIWLNKNSVSQPEKRQKHASSFLVDRLWLRWSLWCCLKILIVLALQWETVQMPQSLWTMARHTQRQCVIVSLDHSPDIHNDSVS